MELKMELSQKQVLSQHMVQSMEILQMSAQELEGYIEKLALENPVIELADLQGMELESLSDGKFSFSYPAEDWEVWEQVTTDFVIIRAGFGAGTLDPQFERNITECNRLGIPCGVYWFSYALSPQAAAEEARRCLDEVRPYRLEYPVCFLDVSCHDVNAVLQIVQRHTASRHICALLLDLQAGEMGAVVFCFHQKRDDPGACPQIQ